MHYSYWRARCMHIAHIQSKPLTLAKMMEQKNKREVYYGSFGKNQIIKDMGGTTAAGEIPTQALMVDLNFGNFVIDQADVSIRMF